jgi:hypothetical protein
LRLALREQTAILQSPVVAVTYPNGLSPRGGRMRPRREPDVEPAMLPCSLSLLTLDCNHRAANM